MTTEQSRILKYAEALMSVPTAPFREHWMCSRLDQLLASIPGVEVKVDRWGNRVAILEGGKKEVDPIAFVAHLDHPGFLLDPNTLSAGGNRIHGTFEGRVFDPFFEGEPAIRLFRDATDHGIPARLVEVSERGGPEDNRQVVVEADESVEGAQLGMWDLSPFDFSEGRIRSRVCDDLAGVASILSTLEVLASIDRSEMPTVSGVFTRAEETGFCGALCMVTDEEAPSPLPHQTCIVSVEISSERYDARVGDGAIIRVGDRSSSFDPLLLNQMWYGTEFDRQSDHLIVKRALMDGGTCEATAFVTMGYRAAGVCAPVANYHNMNQETNSITEEEVALFDLVMLSRLMKTLVHTLGNPNANTSVLRSHMAELTARGQRYLGPVPMETEKVVSSNGGKI